MVVTSCLGAGSGGSVSISASQCAQKGYISARGGNSHPFVANAGGAGGGGRVAIIVSCRVLSVLPLLWC
jgi:uncharacterized membrane protein